MDNQNKKWDLVADIGGTNMRLAKAVAGQVVHQTRYATQSEQSFREIFAAFVKEMGSRPDHVTVASAGIMGPEGVRLTNADRCFSATDLIEACQCANVRILNDFEAAAWSLVTVDAVDLTGLQGPAPVMGQPLPKGNRLIIGPGTGLGVGALAWAGDRPCIIRGEGGHCRLAPENGEEAALFEALIDLCPQVRLGDGLAVEAETVVSGSGLPKLLGALERLYEANQTGFSSSEIFAQAKADPTSLSRKAVDLFCKGLGTLAGDLAVAFFAHGGIFLCGGVLQANPWIFESPVFLNAFNAGGRMDQVRRSMPIYLTQNANLGLVGAINATKYAAV